ncbi:5-hydroxyisourate hydrolase [Paenibacillus yonginensis]|uniref:5-hydroxyisourate hydrolase n=1 Tax=Paenibacillus yonginensis TaxID=1462996 RepID=A0A1B1MVW0_9BACL|nr:hydroxyisourate hydrolase [Paenibacillus yonginensis]ANS73321.1 5-hydroxyisourate hydrolase [Paenibacillus yonginensis]
MAGRGRLTTHVLDLSRGRPAEGVAVTLYKLNDGGLMNSGGSSGGARQLLREAVTNSDGRLDEPLLTGESMEAGLYELEFDVGSYFGQEASGGFLELVPVRFRIAGPDEHVHVPLLAAPGGYSTYRGS